MNICENTFQNAKKDFEEIKKINGYDNLVQAFDDYLYKEIHIDIVDNFFKKYSFFIENEDYIFDFDCNKVEKMTAQYRYDSTDGKLYEWKKNVQVYFYVCSNSFGLSKEDLIKEYESPSRWNYEVKNL